MRFAHIILTILTLAFAPQLDLFGIPAQAAETTADFESEPDLAGLLDATSAMTASKVLPGMTVGSADYPEYGIRIHVFDFEQDRFTLRAAQQKAETGNFAADLVEDGDVFAINGGYFERDINGNLSSSGLLIIDGRTVAEVHERAGSGIIFADTDKVGIAYRQELQERSQLRHAIQVGPVLVDPGGKKGIYKNVGGRFNRSAICLRDESFTAFVVEGGISLFQLADLLSLPRSDGGFGCDTAINLDGGPSTQAVLQAGSARREIVSGSLVHNALIVSKKPER